MKKEMADMIALLGVRPSVGEDEELLLVNSAWFRQLLSGASGSSELADKPASCWTCDDDSCVIVTRAVFMNVHASRGGELGCVITVGAFMNVHGTRDGELSPAAAMVC